MQVSSLSSDLPNPATDLFPHSVSDLQEEQSNLYASSKARKALRLWENSRILPPDFITDDTEFVAAELDSDDGEEAQLQRDRAEKQDREEERAAGRKKMAMAIKALLLEAEACPLAIVGSVHLATLLAWQGLMTCS